MIRQVITVLLTLIAFSCKMKKGEFEMDSVHLLDNVIFSKDSSDNRYFAKVFIEVFESLGNARLQTPQENGIEAYRLTVVPSVGG